MLLRNKDRARLLEIFSSAGYPMEVWAYGSRVTGEAHEGSDLDLVIRGESLKEIPIDIFISLKNQIRNSNIPILIDLFDWPRLPKSFHQNIEENHELLFSNIVLNKH